MDLEVMSSTSSTNNASMQQDQDSTTSSSIRNLMDLEAYIGRYRGETRLQRLLYIASNTTDLELSSQAYVLAEQQMKNDGNAIRYKEVFGGSEKQDSGTQQGGGDHSMAVSRYNNSSQHKFVYDQEFIKRTEVSNRSARDALSSRLSSAQSHLNKEAIRSAYLALAQADILRGDLTEAFHASLRAKDYCTNRIQTAQVSFLVLEVAIHCRNYSQVKDFCLKVQHTLLPNESAANNNTNPATASSRTSITQQQQQLQQQQQQRTTIADKLLIASALERLAHQDYKEAAARFRMVATSENITNATSTTSNTSMSQSTGAGSGLGSPTAGGGGGGAATGSLEWDTLIAIEDIATYAALTSLATCNRHQIIELCEHPEALELVPQIRQALHYFGRRADYKNCLQILEQLRPIFLLDIFLAPHVNDIYNKIREMCILEYWIPYNVVSLKKMAKDLDMNNNESNLQCIVANLIGKGTMKNCRIDCRSMTLIREEGNYNSSTSNDENKLLQAQSLMNNLGKQVLDDTYSMIIRLGCLEHDLCLMDPQQQQQQQQQKGGHYHQQYQYQHQYQYQYGSARLQPHRMGSGGMGMGGMSGGSIGDDGESSDEDTPMIDVTSDQANPEDLY